jgi:hypothetical protein
MQAAQVKDIFKPEVEDLCDEIEICNLPVQFIAKTLSFLYELKFLKCL